MKKKLSTVIALSAVLVMAACSSGNNSASTLPPGKYVNTQNSTSSNGTDTSKQTTTNVGYDANGNKSVNTQTKTTVDPPGLFNKSTTTTNQNQTYPQ